MKPQKIDTSMAEKWLGPETFMYRGKTYRVSGGYWTRGECSPLIVQEINSRETWHTGHEEEKHKMFKIEGLVNGQWDSTNVDGGNSDYNKWDTEEEAEAQIPELIKNFGDEGATADQFRVVEIK